MATTLAAMAIAGAVATAAWNIKQEHNHYRMMGVEYSLITIEKIRKAQLREEAKAEAEAQALKLAQYMPIPSLEELHNAQLATMKSAELLLRN